MYRTEPSLQNKMLTPSEVLLQTLEDLESQDFEVFKWYLGQRGVLEGLPTVPVSHLESANRVQTVDLVMKVYGLHCIDVTKRILAKMNKKQMALELSQFPFNPEEMKAQYQHRLQAKLREKFENICEKVSTSGSTKPFSEVYTDLYLSTMETRDQHESQHEVHQIQARTKCEASLLCTDLFKGLGPTGKPIRTVLTKGVAGVGKTMLVHKFSLDWAEGRTNQDIQLLFPISFRKLNVLRDTEYSLVGLLHHVFSETKEICSFLQLQLLFIFDGLDECRLPLDFSRIRVLTEVTECAPIEVLLVNLIRGNLLPSALLWITTRPAAINQIPADCVSIVTEVQGFTDLQKEQYFRKRFNNDQATAIISHIKVSRILHVMSYIPIFCWILSTVLEILLRHTETLELPQTLTNLYIHFLVVQLKKKNVKYDKKLEGASVWSPENKQMVQSLGKLAFEQLQKGKLIFYESDLSECGLEAAAASVYSGMLTDVFRDECGLYDDQVYCFVHLSVQEFLAALHVHLTFYTSGVNLLLNEQGSSWLSDVFKPPGLYRSAVEQALQSPNGHLDLFLRFLLGLSVEPNQMMLSGFVQKQVKLAESRQDIVKCLEKKIKRCASVDRSLNLFHCLNELHERSLLQQLQHRLSSGCLDSLSPAQWTALVFILLSSHSDLEEFYLKKFCPSEEALLRLLPVVKASTKAILCGCGLSVLSCASLASVLSSSNLTLLDLSNNDLQDSGVEQLCSGLKSTSCRLQTLRLSGCGLSELSAVLLSSVVSLDWSLKELDLSRNPLKDSGLQLLCEGLKKPHCPLETLRLSCCGLTEGTGAFLREVLTLGSSRLKELDLKHNHIQDQGARALTQNLPHCALRTLSLASCKLSGDSWGTCAVKILDLSNNTLRDNGLKRVCSGLGLDSGLETLRLSGCGLSTLSWAYLASVLSSSSLTLLDLSNNDLQDSGVEKLFSGLKSAPCRLQTLSLAGCKLTQSSSGPLSSVIGLDLVEDLDLSNNALLDSGLKSLVSAALEVPWCSLKKLRLENCGLSALSCAPLASVLSSSSLTLLDLSNNDLQDSGVELLCSGLKSATCRLQTLSLSGCLVSQHGCKCLVSALNSNPSHLRELDLSYNHPGEKGLKLLQALSSLRTLRTDHSGALRLRPGFKKYLFVPSVDLNSVHSNLHVSADLRTVRCETQECPYPPHEERFNECSQVLFSEPLIGRCFLEVECQGLVIIAVSYKCILRKGKSKMNKLGGNPFSWGLYFSSGYCSVWHDNRQLVMSRAPESGQGSNTLGVYVDSDSGFLSFYLVLLDKLILLQSFSNAFMEPLFAGVRFSTMAPGSSITVRSTEKPV